MDPARFATDIARLRGGGWSCRWRDDGAALPPEIGARYPWLPEDYLEFVRGLELCASPDDKRWFLAPSDFDRREDHAFTHDEWERLSLDAARGDVALTDSIVEFWDRHIPIYFDVSESYAFHALRVADHLGTVVSGREPEFEDVSLTAKSFTAFLSQLR